MLPMQEDEQVSWDAAGGLQLRYASRHLRLPSGLLCLGCLRSRNSTDSLGLRSGACDERETHTP